MKWDVVCKKFGFIVNSFMDIKNKQPIFIDKNYYIAQVKYQNTGHFCNIIEFDGENVKYFDVYNGLLRTENIKNLISIREIIFIRGIA